MKKILIAGGAGFLGSHLTNKLSEDNHVIVLDNFYTGFGNKFKNNVTVINHNIIHPFDMKVDEIYNLACPASPIHYQKDPIFTLKTSVYGTLNLLELAKKYNAKFFQASTSEIYGDPFFDEQKEDYHGNVNPIGIRACYDEGKRAAETLCFDFYRQFNTDIKVARIFNTYGPNMNIQDGRVVSNFIIQALKEEDITIYGDGSQTRSFCYVDDLINGFISLMNSNEHGPINLGNPETFTMIELAEKILELTNSKSKIIFKELPSDDPKKRRPDISKAKTTLNWEPKISLEEGLIKTINYFKGQL